MAHRISIATLTAAVSHDRRPRLGFVVEAPCVTRQISKTRKFQVHAGDQKSICSDLIEEPFAGFARGILIVCTPVTPSVPT
jgi:hypothetical protein